MCVNYVFCVVFDCWMSPDGRWCCRTIFGHPDVARVMQLIEDGERLRVVAWLCDVSPNIVSGVRSSYWRVYQHTG